MRWRGIAVGAILALCAAGCGASSTTSTDPASASSHTFIDLVPQLPSDLDESGTPDQAQIEILPSWSSELVRPAGAAPGPHATLPDASAVVPYLATSWQRSPNGDYTFQLRRGVRGATGDLFTAADVQWSFQRELAVSPVAPFLFGLANIDTRDPLTILSRFAVRVNVTAPSPFLLGVLAWFDEGIYDRDVYLAHASASDPWAEQWGSTNSATFGAYYVGDFVPYKKLVLVANPGSWVHPYYTKVVIKQVTDPGVRLNSVFAGSADHTSALSWGDFTSAVQYGELNHVSATILQRGPLVESWLLDVAKGPLAKPLVRRALNLAVNRAELNDAVYAGNAESDALAIPAIYGQPQPLDFDPALARRLLARAGYPHGLTLRVDLGTAIGAGSESQEIRVLISQLAQVGITLTTTTVSDADQLLALQRAHQIPSTIEDVQPLLSGAAFLLIQDDAATLDGVSPAAEDGYSNPALLALLTQLRNTPGGRLHRRLVARAEHIVDDDVPAVNLLATPVQNVTNSNIVGYAAYAVPVTYYEYLHPAG